MGKEGRLDISSAGLHILAMGLMLCDHLWAVLFPAQEWLTCIGRLAYPIFAFLLAEGYMHTRRLRQYLLRMLLFSLLAEVPFDLMYGGSSLYPYHQNVLWTFLLSLTLMRLIDSCRARFRPFVSALCSAGLILLGYLLGYVAMLDYYGVGVLMALTFYFFRGQGWKSRLLQLICLYICNVHMLGGYYYTFRLWGHELEVVQQGFALLALLPIWLYRGRQGLRGRAFRYFCYGFYPGHMLLLVAIREWLLR